MGQLAQALSGRQGRQKFLWNEEGSDRKTEKGVEPQAGRFGTVAHLSRPDLKNLPVVGALMHHGSCEMEYPATAEPSFLVERYVDRCERKALVQASQEWEQETSAGVLTGGRPAAERHPLPWV